MRSAPAPASTASTTLAAWEVEPLASSVEKSTVSFPFGRWLIKGEISTWATALPSSARIFIAVSSVMTYSLPSPLMWLYTPSSRAFRRVDLPW